MKKFQLVSQFRSYVTKPDVTNTSIRNLVSGSQNVLINDAEKVSIRNGYTLDGAANTALNAIESSYDWDTSTAVQRNLRSYDDELEFRFTSTADVTTWTRLADGWSNVDFVFTTWWDTTEAIDLLLFVVGDSNIYEWSGGVAEVSSVTSNTITKTGTNTFAQDRFYTTRNKIVIINGTEYTYTGGSGTTTLTGVTPDPSGEAVGSAIVQKIVTNTNQPASSLQNDVISVLNNQIYVGSLITNEVYVSKNSSITDYTFSSPRVPGEGALLTLNNPTVGLAPLEDRMAIFGGKDDIFVTEFNALNVGSTLTETLDVKKLKTGGGKGAISHDLITSVGDGIAYVSNEPALRLLSRIENIQNPQLSSLSDPIKPDFDAETFTSGHIKFHKNRIYIATPTNDKLYILQFKENAQGKSTAFWQPPQILPLRRLAVFSDVLYGHSSSVPETYKLFDGTSDNNKSFKSIAKFAYRNFGDRAQLKSFDEFMTEGYISSNTTLTMTLNYDFEGSEQILQFNINGADSSILFETTSDASLGVNPLGESSLSGTPTDSTQNPKFRIINEISRSDFFEMQVSYETNDIDQSWEILSHGANVSASPQQPINIKQ